MVICFNLKSRKARTEFILQPLIVETFSLIVKDKKAPPVSHKLESFLSIDGYS